MTTLLVTASGAGTFTVPDGVTSLTIEAWGAGGSGGGAASGDASGGGGGGYSLAIVSVNPGQTVFYTVGVGASGTSNPGTAGGVSWINPSANSQPASNGVVAAGGSGGNSGSTNGGAGSVGTTNFSGGKGSAGGAGGTASGGGGGGGAGSAGVGGDGAAESSGAPVLGGSGGSPDGGAGGNGGSTNNPPTPTAGTQPGGGGGGNWTGTAASGGDGQVRFTWIALPAGPNVVTTLTNVPGKHFTKKQYGDLLSEIRDEAIAANQLLKGLSDKERADLDFDLARIEFEELESSLGPTNYAKAMDAKEKLDRARKNRDHHYFMEVVNKEIAKYNESKKK